MPPDDNWCFDRVQGRLARYRRRTGHGPFVGATYDRDGAVAFLAALFLSERNAVDCLRLAALARQGDATERRLGRRLMRAAVRCAVGKARSGLDYADQRHVPPRETKASARVTPRKGPMFGALDDPREAFEALVVRGELPPSVMDDAASGRRRFKCETCLWNPKTQSYDRTFCARTGGCDETFRPFPNSADEVEMWAAAPWQRAENLVLETIARLRPWVMG